MQSYDSRIAHPSTMLICGPSGSGKTSFTLKLLEYSKDIFKPCNPAFVILIYETWQSSYDIMIENNWVNQSIKGLTNMNYLKEVFEENKEKGGTLLIIDDQMQKIDENMITLFTVYSHHLNVSCLLLTQSLFLNNKLYRIISLNSNYIILMKNTRDSSCVSLLAKQTHPFRTRFVTDSYIDATRNPYSYLLLDLRQETPDEIRLRANIFSDQVSVYTQKQ